VKKFGGAWSQSKLDCVERYTLAYLQVMQKQVWCRLDYVDAFAGRGKQALKSTSTATGPDDFFGDASDKAETEEFLVGSAIRALSASEASARSFDRFHFIEADQSSCDELQSLVAEEFAVSAGCVQVVCGDANGALRDYIGSVDWSKTRTLVFLDPYGLEVDWVLVEELAATHACDVWYLFPLGGVIRMMTNDGQIPDLWSQRLDELFGTHDWHDEFYKPSPQQSLFELDDAELLKDASTQHVVEYIRTRLSTVFAAVSNAAVLRNSKGAPLFALVLGVSNPSLAAQKAALAVANHLVKDLSQL
jgi:three-Cys-motif partner protein